MNAVALPRLVVLLGEDEILLPALLNACASGELAARVVAVIAEKPDAPGLDRARLARVPALAKVKPKAQERREYDAELAELVTTYQPDWILLDDWTRPLTPAFLGRFPRRTLRVHPALPCAFPGSHAIERAYYAFCRGEIDHTGASVQLAEADESEGQALAEESIPITADDTLESLEARLRAVEPSLLVSTLRQLLAAENLRD